MGYYYVTLAFEIIIFLMILGRLIPMVVRLKKGRLNKKWWLLVGILLPFLAIFVVYYLYLPLLDLPDALKGETEVVKGTVSDVYFPGGDNGFVLEGEEYRRNPWAFDPEPGETYRLHFLPNSHYVIEVDRISE